MSFLHLIEGDLAKATETGEDAAILQGYDKSIVASSGFCMNALAFPMSREMALDHGLVEPTPQEVADRAARAAVYRVEAARREIVRVEWFSALLDAAGPVARAILEEHTPGRFDDCEGDGFDAFAGLSWPCNTVLVGARAAGVEVPEEIW